MDNTRIVLRIQLQFSIQRSLMMEQDCGWYMGKAKTLKTETVYVVNGIVQSESLQKESLYLSLCFLLTKPCL